MTTVDQVVPIEPAAAAPMPVASRLIGAIAVGVALLSATATFLVMAGLTPIAPVELGGQGAAARQSGNRVAPARHHRSGGLGGGSGAAPRPRRLAAARADRRLVRGHCRSADRLGCRRSQHNTRSRSRPILRDPHTGHDRTVHDRGRRLCQRARPGDPWRGSGDGLRPGPRQAHVRSGPRPVPQISHRAGHRARPFGRHHHHAERWHRGACRRHDGQDDRAAVARASQRNYRDRAASRPHSRGRPRRRRHQAARLRRHVSVCRATARPARRAAITRDAGKRQRICQSRRAPPRHPDRLRADVYRYRAHRAFVVGVDRPRFRQSPGRSDPPPDWRGQRRFDGQSAHSGSGAPIGRRSRPARRDLQQDDT